MSLPTWRENPLFHVMFFLVTFMLVFFLGAKALQTISQTGRPAPLEHTIYVEGVGKTTMIPDIAVMTFGVSTQQKTVADAQKENSKIMNAMIEKIKATGVESKDLQTKDYSAYEKTDWNQETQKSISVGWVITQSLEVKIRNTENISKIIEIAGQNGSNKIIGPTFQVDDSRVYEATARAKALEDAKKKAESIAESLGVSIERVIGYSEWKEDASPYPVAYKEGMGGGGIGGPAPSIETGTQEFKLHTTVTYLLSK